MPIQLHDLYKSYRGRPVLTGVTFTFPERGLCLLTGPSGCGKTTLLRLIAGLEKPDSGSVIGGPVQGICFQEYRLFPQLTALENASAMNRPSQARCEAMLLELGFTKEQLDLYPGELSGGMKQRVSLVRALTAPPGPILLDEPLKEMDDALRRQALSLIRARSHDASVILSAHSPRELHPAPDALLELARGRMGDAGGRENF